VSSLDPESLLDSQLRAGRPEIDPTEYYCIELNLQYDIDISSSPLHIRHLHLIKAKFALTVLECPFFLCPYKTRF
jgi:hypothetical protein